LFLEIRSPPGAAYDQACALRAVTSSDGMTADDSSFDQTGKDFERELRAKPADRVLE
jgi:GMP synthase PP-ATPase subunit